MVRGHPDYQTFEGRSIGGAKINAATFSGEIAAGAQGTVDAGAVPSGERHTFINFNISVADDTAIHRVQLLKKVSGDLMSQERFVTSANINVNTFDLVAGEEGRLAISNNASSALTFVGIMTWLVREI